MRQLAPSVFMLLLFCGCGSTQQVDVSYDADANKTSYQTRSYTVSSFSGASLGSSKSISLRAIAQCLGKECTPERIQLVFSAGGSQELSLSGLDGEIVAGNQRITWSGKEASTGGVPSANNRVINVVGRFAVVDITLDEAEAIYSASNLQGSIGGTNLDLGTGVKSGIHNLLQNMNGTH